MTNSTEPTRRTVLRRGATAGSLVLAGTAFSGTAAAGRPDRCTLNWGKRLNANRCDGDLRIDVTQAVVNDIDSGHHGFWAYDDYRRHIQAWEVADGEFCALVTYHGQFEAVGGQPSPGLDDAGGKELSGNERGTMQGGYAATIEGTLADDAIWPLRGFVGTHDYEGNVQTGELGNAVDWVSDVYFEDSSFAFDWWGWIYHGGRYGTWVNAADTDCGDIHD